MNNFHAALLMVIERPVAVGTCASASDGIEVAARHSAPICQSDTANGRCAIKLKTSATRDRGSHANEKRPREITCGAGTRRQSDLSKPFLLVCSKRDSVGPKISNSVDDITGMRTHQENTAGKRLAEKM